MERIDEKTCYFIICAPPGSGLRESVQKFKDAVSDLDYQDLEKILCELLQTEEALSHAGIKRPHDGSEWPTIYDVTWNLSRSQVAELWGVAAKEALHRLNKSTSPNKILFCHLSYYCGRRTEFYSPVNTSLLKKNSLSPSHILVLIDDVYDMYLRLIAEKQLFNPKTRMREYWARIKEDEGIDIKTLPYDQLASLCLEWQIEVMAELLSWRYLEIILAENLAIQFKTNFLVFGIKQLTAVASLWLQKHSPVSVYFSHPISRLRRKYREEKQWHEVVDQFNKLQMEFYNAGIVCIMPTAIDEYRIKRMQRSGALALREPILEDRWPLPSAINSVIYSIPGTPTDINHSELLIFKTWNFEKEEFVRLSDPPGFLFEKADKSLKAFERQIEFQISSKDHLFVSWCNGMLIFRPLFLDGEYSSGVRAEISHWKLLAKANCKKRAAFIHFDEDVAALIHLHNSDPKRAEEMRAQIKSELTKIVEEISGIEKRIAESVIKHIEEDRPSEMLDRGPIAPKDITEIRNKFPEYKKMAQEIWLWKKLTGHDIGISDVPENQIAAWVFKDMNGFKSKYSEIANFLKTGAIQPIRYSFLA